MKKNDLKTHLTGAQYWEWRTTITEMQLAEEKKKNCLLMLKLLSKDTEIMAKQGQIYQLTSVKDAEANHSESKAEYERTKERIEKALGYSLNGKVIDDVTFEIRDLPKQNLKEV